MTKQMLILVSLTSLLLGGCKSDMTISVDLSDLNNPESNGKVINGKMNIELSGGCIDQSTGAESESLVSADGIMYNLFNHRQIRSSCTQQDKYGFSSIAKYSFEILLDTIKDGKAPKEGFPLHIIAHDKSVNLYADSIFIKRLKSKMNSSIPITYSIYVDINNSNGLLLDISTPSIYMFSRKEQRYKPIQEGYGKGLKSSLKFKLGSVTIDTLLDTGGAYILEVTKH